MNRRDFLKLFGMLPFVNTASKFDEIRREENLKHLIGLIEEFIIYSKNMPPDGFMIRVPLELIPKDI